MLGAEGISLPTTVSFPLTTQPGAKVKGGADARLKDTAKEMEATFLSMLLKEMRQTLDPEDGLFPGDSADVEGGLFDLYMSQHLAAAGGVGLAAAIVRQMQATGGPPTATTHEPTRPVPSPDGGAAPAPRPRGSAAP